MNYRDFFELATGFAPFPFQERFQAAVPRPVSLEVATGLGKTETTILPFVFAVATGGASARRFVYVLPMRTLVEQTRRRVEGWVARLRDAGVTRVPGVGVLLGGDVDDAWIEQPEEPYVLIGTQDMMLSRALNRGYGSSPFRWPVAFGLLNNDADWVLDEVQLQGVGARTGAQLQGLRDRLGTLGTTTTTFMSATIERDWIDTVDHAVEEHRIFRLTNDDRADATIVRRTRAPKRVQRLDVPHDSSDAMHDAVLRMHRAGTLTLVILNQVRHAQQFARGLRKRTDVPVELIHGRFRPRDRASVEERAFGATDSRGRIVVATQVVEAGVDVDATTVVSHLAPWSSIVQRLGRCNRRGEAADAVFAWIDIDDRVRGAAAPYRADELTLARNTLIELEGKSGAPDELPRIPMALEAGATLRKIDVLDLFDTAPDLSGNDVDVSRFIREATDFTASVFWRPSPPHGKDDRVRRDELCPALVDDVRAIATQLRKQGHVDRIRVRRTLAKGADAVWQSALHETSDIRPGTVVWLRSDVGRYTALDGFDAESKEAVAPVDAFDEPVAVAECDETESMDGDTASYIGVSVSLQMHAVDTRDHARRLVAAMHPTVEPFGDAVVTAALWHDAGKVHHVFQRTLRAGGAPAEGGPWAKAPHGARHERLHFRHEVGSALTWLHEHEGTRDDDLVAYLVAAHHGKLRVGAWPYPGEPIGDEHRLLGMEDGDVLPRAALDGEEVSPETTVDLRLFGLGSTDGLRTWSERVLALRDDGTLGPFRLALLEALVRVSDWRASSQRAKRKATTAGAAS